MQSTTGKDLHTLVSHPSSSNTLLPSFQDEKQPTCNAFAVVVAGKGTNKKTTLYVGGLEENVNEAILHSAFIPFGDIKDVNIPMDNTTGKHRGFGFVEYENAEVSLQLSA